VKGAFKRLMTSSVVQRCVGFALALLLRLVKGTTRWTEHGFEHFDRLHAAKQPFVACFWHGRIMMTPFVWRLPIPFQMLISSHRDGRLIAATVRNLNVDTIWGSSNRNGGEALRALIRELKRGRCVGVTPDGPRGPRMRVKAGAVVAARAAKAPIVPIAFGVQRRRVLNTWDRFVVALPFGSGVFMVGAPIDVTQGAIEDARLAVERAMLDLTAAADRLTGHDPIAPAEWTPHTPSEEMGQDTAQDLEAGAA
jgi:lysophospholipid acyltransferase (LPLAT)-like uncharacterized protein